MRNVTRVQEIMDERGITIEDLADALNISKITMHNYYYGKKVPGKVIALNMAKILDVEFDYLMNKEDK